MKTIAAHPFGIINIWTKVYGSITHWVQDYQSYFVVHLPIYASTAQEPSISVNFMAIFPTLWCIDVNLQSEQALTAESWVCAVFWYLCTAQVGCTPDKLRGSVGTPRPGACALEDTPPHTGACVGQEVVHSWGSEWRFSHRTHSLLHSCGTPGLQDNPWWRPKTHQSNSALPHDIGELTK